MGLASTLEQFLRHHGVPFDAIEHPRAFSSDATAEAAEIHGAKLAKSVVVEDARRYWAVVIPATTHVDLRAARGALGRQCGLATEPEIANLFPGCELGALPALPQAFGLGALVDRALLGLDEVYSQSGDHGLLIRLRGHDFAALMRAESTGTFGVVWHAEEGTPTPPADHA